MMGLIAHPGEISSLSVSGDGNYLMTAGGKDLTVNVWKINTQAVQVTEWTECHALGSTAARSSEVL